jgi:hypothetical protein
MRVVAVTASYSGLQSLMPVVELQAIVSRSVSHWNSELNHCCAVRFEVKPPVSDWLAVEDRTNLIVFRQQHWCHNERCGSKSTFPLGTLAITSNYPESASGKALREGDIEVDARQLHAVTNISDATGPINGLLRTSSGYWVLARQGDQTAIPLEVVLTHELGHVLGLKDACVGGYRVGGYPTLGHCSDEQRTSVMYADARQLKPTKADLAEVADLYPLTFGAASRVFVRDHFGFHVLLVLGLLLLFGLLSWPLIRERKR